MCERFGRECLKTVVGQICQNFGFQGIQSSACETLADILQKYIEDVGVGAHLYAEHSGRSECNAFDVQVALEELYKGDPQEMLKDLRRFQSASDDTEFARNTPTFPSLVGKGQPYVPVELASHPEHIPAHLPPFPDVHTYIQTASYDDQSESAQRDRKKRTKEQLNVEGALVRLTQSEAPDALANYQSRLPLSQVNPLLPQGLKPAQPHTIKFKEEKLASKPAGDLRVMPSFLVAMGDELAAQKRSQLEGGGAGSSGGGAELGDKKRKRMEKILNGDQEVEDEEEEGMQA